MKYYLGVDYFLYFEDFPHMGIPGVIASNSDGTVNIYINTLYAVEIQKRAIKHELRHFVKNHFYCDWMSISEKELDADDIDDPNCIFADDFTSVEYTGPEIQCPAPVAAPKKESFYHTVRVGKNEFTLFRSSDMPAGVSFGFHATDDSMSPLFSKDSIVYCDLQDLCPGDLGVFVYNGDAFCRQYHKDVFGFTYLFTIDRKKAYQDIIIPSSKENTFKCIGRVRTEKRIPLPGTEYVG